METHQTGPPMVLCSSELVHYWFSCGFVCGADVVQIWHTLTPLWSNAGSVSFRCCTLGFKVGSRLDQMCFRCGSIWVQIKPNVLKSLGQGWFRFHAQLVHGWFDGCSNLPDVWFCAGSSVVHSTLDQIWFRLGSALGSHVAHMWFRCGSWSAFGSSC